jgi:hypothetical protein
VGGETTAAKPSAATIATAPKRAALVLTISHL